MSEKRERVHVFNKFNLMTKEGSDRRAVMPALRHYLLMIFFYISASFLLLQMAMI